MREENAIEVRDITKSFKVYMDRSNNVKDFLIHKNRRRNEVRDVLKGISFDVKKGEAVGLIGRNGCGKSTTLKLLTRIMYPDSGSIEMRGRVTSLIELGAGFHPDMSGRENIYINASIFGLSKSEIDARVQDIIDFSELADYIDNPVRTYSSGMYMRLAFAVAINVDADILLIDEILAVGDIAFQSKCYRKLKEIRKQGVTIVLVSHALGQVESICDTTIWIKDGVIKMKGRPKEVHAYYIDDMSSESGGEEVDQSVEDLKKKCNMQLDYINRMRSDLEKACRYLEETKREDILPDAITQARMDAETVTEEEIEAAFNALNPDKSKRYLYYGCVGHSDMIKKLRKNGYQVYGYEPYVLDNFVPYVMCGRDKIKDMRFDEIFDVKYLDNAVDRKREEAFMESIRSGKDNKRIEMLYRLNNKANEKGEEGISRKIDGSDILFGPYCSIYEGFFRVHYKFHLEDGGKYAAARLRVTADVGEEVLAEAVIENDEGYVDFSTDKICENVEFVVDPGNSDGLVADSIVLEILDKI